MTTSMKKKEEIVACLDEIDALMHECDTDIIEIRIAKVREILQNSKEFNQQEKETAGNLLENRNWDDLIKYLDDL